MREHTQLITGMSFVLKSKAIHQKELRKNRERVNKGKRGEREICSVVQSSVHTDYNELLYFYSSQL